jgi:hypothetical protein
MVGATIGGDNVCTVFQRGFESTRTLRNIEATYMEESAGPNTTSPPETGYGVADRLSDAASQAKRKASDVGHMAADKIDANRAATAGKLDTAASVLHEKADAGGRTIAAAAHTAADAMSSSAEYIRDHDTKAMVGDIQRLVKNNPGPMLLGAVVLGFLVARSFSRD